MARSVGAFKRGAARVNEQWYLENQVLLVLHLLATSCVDWQSTGNEHYSLQKLCEAMSVDAECATKALSHGVIVPTWPKPDTTSACAPAAVGSDHGPRKSRKRSRSVSSTARQVCRGPDDRHPGWDVIGIQRPSSTHVDNYWRHPELPEGVHVRSQVGIRTLNEYAEKNNVGIRAAYEANAGQAKFFRTNFHIPP